MSYTYEFPRPALTVDTVVVRGEREHEVLLIRRKHDPYAGKWAIPGGFVDENESLEEAARRELKEEANVDARALEQLYTFGDKGRDPRGWTVSVVYLTKVDGAKLNPRAADDAAEVEWFSLKKLPPLAFDHDKILSVVQSRLDEKGKAPK